MKMSEELATVRDLIGLIITFKFDVGDKNILKRLQSVNDYIKDEPIYKEDLDKLISDMQNDFKSKPIRDFSETYLKNGFIYAPLENCKYTSNTDGIFEEQGDLKGVQNIVLVNKKTFCKLTFDDDSIFVREGKYLAYLNNVTHYMYADTKEILYSASQYDLAHIYYNFQAIMQSCYKYLNSITDLTDEQILSLWHIAIGHHYKNTFSNELETNSKIVQEIFDKINKDSFTQISYKEYKDKMDVHITKSIMQGAAKRIPITAYALITNEIPYVENISSLNYVDLTEYIENQYKAPKDKPLKDFINVEDLKYYPYWKKE